MAGAMLLLLVTAGLTLAARTQQVSHRPSGHISTRETPGEPCDPSRDPM